MALTASCRHRKMLLATLLGRFTGNDHEPPIFDGAVRRLIGLAFGLGATRAGPDSTHRPAHHAIGGGCANPQRRASQHRTHLGSAAARLRCGHCAGHGADHWLPAAGGRNGGPDRPPGQARPWASACCGQRQRFGADSGLGAPAPRSRALGRLRHPAHPRKTLDTGPKRIGVDGAGAGVAPTLCCWLGIPFRSALDDLARREQLEWCRSV